MAKVVQFPSKPVAREPCPLAWALYLPLLP